MNTLDSEQVEKTGDRFSVEAILEARRRTWQALETIAGRIKPGMTEEEGLRLANATLVELGAEKRWHRSYIRFDVNTVCPYGTPSTSGVVLQEDGIFFLDIGPVWDGLEGDAGQTFAVGSDPEKQRCARDVKVIYDQVRAHWEQARCSGAALYEYAEGAARSRGWTLNLPHSNGHRLSDFPHALYYRGTIQGLDFSPSSCRWVLEIQIRHPEQPFGAFFEDILR